jgi:poly(hydroxyalkanoate) depolymerase family esterase
MNRTHYVCLALLFALILPACSDDAAPVADAAPDALRDGVVPDGPVATDGTPDAPAVGKLTERSGFGSNPGALKMYTYAPAPPPAGKAPLVLVLHGCSQSAKVFLSESGWDRLADRLGLHLVLPEQQLGNNIAGCFNWFSPADSARGKGEAASIMQMLDHAKTLFSVDDARLFVTGVSAGGAMTAALLAAHPDRFAGGAVMAGVPAGCATDVGSGTACMQGVDKTAKQWGDLARLGLSTHAGPWPLVTLFHGSADPVVVPLNLDELAEQWTDVHGCAGKSAVSDVVKGHARRSWKDSAGRTVVQAYAIQGMGHGVSVDPGSAVDQGGKTGAFAFDKDLWAAYHAAKHWGLNP